MAVVVTVGPIEGSKTYKAEVLYTRPDVSPDDVQFERGAKWTISDTITHEEATGFEEKAGVLYVKRAADPAAINPAGPDVTIAVYARDAWRSASVVADLKEISQGRYCHERGLCDCPGCDCRKSPQGDSA